MATTQPKSGVTEFSITTGTGPLTLTGAAPGFRGFVSADDGLVYHYAIYQSGTAFETGKGTYTHSSRQLSRTTVRSNISGTTSPLNLGAGTKEVSVTLTGEDTAMLDCEGEWAADQKWNGYRQYLDADQDSWIDMSTDDTYKFFPASVQALEITGGLGNITLIGTNDTATEGPELTLRRDSATPAASDALGVLRMQGKDANGTTQSTFKLRSSWLSTTAGTFTSIADFSIASSGALQSILQMRPNTVVVPSGIALMTAGKTATSLTTSGTELSSTGHIDAICMNGDTPLHLGRPAGDGNFIGLYANGVAVAAVSNVGGTVTWGAFTSNHYGDFAADVGPEHDEFGTVLACTGTLLATTPDPIYELRPAVAGDRRVLGVYGGRRQTAIMGGIERSLIVLFASGNGWVRATGPITAGDLLWASEVAGVAERQPNQDQIGPWTVAKATSDSADDDGERLVSCIYMAG